MYRPLKLLGTLVITLSITSAALASKTGMKPMPANNAPLGYLIHNPYQNAPLTALVTLAGHHISNVEVTVHAKGKKGVPIHYQVSDIRIIGEGGVPIFGLYADHLNTFTVNWHENEIGRAHV